MNIKVSKNMLKVKQQNLQRRLGSAAAIGQPPPQAAKSKSDWW
jgi:hypothetical protein